MASTTQHTRCLSCHRVLRSAKSIANGRGPTCARKVREAAKAAALRDFKPAQVDRAVELIEQGGIVPFRGRRMFRAISNDGTRTYLTAPQACSCKAGLKGRHACFHRIAATILAAA